MRVLVNGLAALKPKTGVGHYVAQLVEHLSAAYPADTFDLYPGERAGRLIRRLVGRAGSTRGRNPTTRPSPMRRLKQSAGALAKELAKLASAAHFRGYSRLPRADVYHEPNFIPYRSGLPTVITVHDLSVVRHPDWHPADRVRFHDRHFVRSLERADHVIVVSDAVRKELLADTGIPANRVTTVHNGVHPTMKPQHPTVVDAVRHRYGLPEKYFLYVGTIEPRKNVGTILRAYADLPGSVRAACPLALAGPWGWKSDADRDLFERTAARSGARHLGYVPDADLPGLYAGATALLYPTRYEGFGFPPVEMLACGGAVLASTADAVREVVDRHGELLDPDDFVGWRDAMRRVATDADYRGELRAGGIIHAARFTWHRAARETMSVYQAVTGSATIAADAIILSRSAAA